MVVIALVNQFVHGRVPTAVLSLVTDNNLS